MRLKQKVGTTSDMYSLFCWFTQLATQTNVIDAFCCSYYMAKNKRPHQDCDLCFVNAKRFSSKCKNKTAYPNLDSARRPVSHDASTLVSLRLLGSLASDPDEVEHSASNKSLQKAKCGPGCNIYSRRTSLLLPQH